MKKGDQKKVHSHKQENRRLMWKEYARLFRMHEKQTKQFFFIL